MQGAAGDYVFDELSREQQANYKELIKCLKRHFCKVESIKTYAAIFWKHDQKSLKLRRHMWMNSNEYMARPIPSRNLSQRMRIFSVGS